MTAFCACNRVERYTEAVPNGGGAIIDRWRCVDCGCHYERQAPIRAELGRVRSALATIEAEAYERAAIEADKWLRRDGVEQVAAVVAGAIRGLKTKGGTGG
jgi:hypothetical protein